VKPSATQSMVRINRLSFERFPNPATTRPVGMMCATPQAAVTRRQDRPTLHQWMPHWEHTAPRLLPSSCGSVSPAQRRRPFEPGDIPGPRQRQDCPIHTTDSVASVLGDEQLAGRSPSATEINSDSPALCRGPAPRVRPPPACRRRRHPARWVRAHDTRGRARRGPVGRRRCIRPDHRASCGHRGRPGGAGRRGRRRAGPCPLRSSHQQRREKGAIVALVAGPTGMVIGGLWWPPPRVVPAPATGSSAALRVSPET
jgi:hypothetical protein